MIIIALTETTASSIAIRHNSNHYMLTAENEQKNMRPAQLQSKAVRALMA